MGVVRVKVKVVEGCGVACRGNLKVRRMRTWCLNFESGEEGVCLCRVRVESYTSLHDFLPFTSSLGDQKGWDVRFDSSVYLGAWWPSYPSLPFIVRA